MEKIRKAIIGTLLTILTISCAYAIAPIISNIWQTTIPYKGVVEISEVFAPTEFILGTNNVTLLVKNRAGIYCGLCTFYINVTVPPGFDIEKLDIYENETGTYEGPLSKMWLDGGIRSSFLIDVDATYEKLIDISFIFYADEELGDYTITCWMEKHEEVPPKYTTGLTVKFKIYDTATYALLDTGDVSPEFYAAGTDPLGVHIFTEEPIAVGVYFTTGGYWTVPLDAGPYTVLIKKGTTSIYPEVFTVTVTGTDSEDKEVWLSPSTLNIYERSTDTISTAILAYHAAGGVYNITASTLDTTLYDKWFVTHTFTISGSAKVVKAGRIYLTKISGLIPTEYSLDGSSKVAVLEDTDAADDGMMGYYIGFDEWEAGEIHRLDLYYDDYGATGIAGTITVKVFEYYACVNTVQRWWTDGTTTVTVEA